MKEKQERSIKLAKRKLQFILGKKVKDCEMSFNEACQFVGSRTGYSTSYIKKLSNQTAKMSYGTSINILKGLGPAAKKRFRLKIEYYDKARFDRAKELSMQQRRDAIEYYQESMLPYIKSTN